MDSPEKRATRAQNIRTLWETLLAPNWTKDDLIDLGAGMDRVAVYEFDGINCTQLSLDDARESSSMIDLMRDWKLGEYAEAAVLKRPEDAVASIAKWLILLAILVASVVTIWNSNHSANVIAQAAKNTPAMNISIQNGKILTYLQTQQINQTKQISAVDGALVNLSRYLNNHP